MNDKIEIEYIGVAGDGVGTLNGKSYYVPYTAPGDVVSVQNAEQRGTGIAAEATEFFTKSELHAPAQCKHYGTCGGCSVQHLQDEFVENWKSELITSALKTKELPVPEIKAVETSPIHSRRRVEFVAAKRKKGVMIGYHRPKSHQIFDVGECPLLLPELVALIKPLRTLLPELLARNSQARLTLTMTNNGVDLVIATAHSLDLEGREKLARFAQDHKLCRLTWNDDVEKLQDQIAAVKPAVITVGDVETQLPAGGFLQATEHGQETLVRLVCAELGAKEKVVDLFAGCGTFSLPAAKHAREVLAVEGNEYHTDNMKIAANRQMLPLQTETRDLFRRPLLADEFKPFDTVIIDPPRAGAKAQVEEIARSKITKVLAISCNPKSFARDAEVLIDYGFKMGPITPVDQFRWSNHVELFTTFTR